MSLRVISGTAKGRKLKLVPGDITRPITDRVKEALFNILGADVIDSSWWDMFGGTGAVGIEAISRGAAFVRFTDLNRGPIETIKTNLTVTRFISKAEADYSLYASTNLAQANWSMVGTTNPAAMPFQFTDPGASNFSQQFYRILLGP